MRKKPREKLPKTRWRKSRLEELVERAVAGASGDEEEQLGFFTAIEEQLRFPFRTRLADGEVKVLGIEAGEDDEIVAVCLRDGERRGVPLLELPLPKPPPRGAEWIEAYRLWVSE